ncbi:MAG TPA: hypothetical protein VLM18_01535 [Croceibacterium sp.]|nr:hypothetical protein [Croceibacterium sp.]
MANPWTWPWYLGWASMAVGLGIAAWSPHIDGEHRSRRIFPKKAPPSPISASNGSFVDFDFIRDNKGEIWDGIYSFGLCIRVENGLSTGEVLRNVQARVQNLDSEDIQLPIRGADSGCANIRHGEHILIEVGRMVMAPVGNSIPGAPRSRQARRTIGTHEMDVFRSAMQDHRTLEISNVVNAHTVHIVEARDNRNDGAICKLSIVVSADEVISKRLVFSTDLFADDASRWLERVEEG